MKQMKLWIVLLLSACLSAACLLTACAPSEERSEEPSAETAADADVRHDAPPLRRLTADGLKHVIAQAEGAFASPELAMATREDYTAYLEAVKEVVFRQLGSTLEEGMGVLSDDVQLFSGVYSPGYVILSDMDNGRYASAEEMLRTVWKPGSGLTLQTSGCAFSRIDHIGIYTCDGAGNETQLFPTEEQRALLESLPRAGMTTRVGYGHAPENVIDEARFRLLSEGFSYAQMVYLLGYPTRPVGSGLWIDGYELADGGLGMVWFSHGEQVEHIEVLTAEDREAQAAEAVAVYLRTRVYAAVAAVDRSTLASPDSAYPDLEDPNSPFTKEWNAHFSEFDASAAPFLLEWVLGSDGNGAFEAFLVSGANRLAGRKELLGAANGTEAFSPYDCPYGPYTPKWYAFQLQSVLNEENPSVAS